MAAAQKAQDLSALERATKPWTVAETGKQLPDCFAALKVAGCPTSSRLRAQEQLRRCRTAMHKRTNTLWAMANEGRRLPAVIETLCKAAAQKSRRRSAMHELANALWVMATTSTQGPDVSEPPCTEAAQEVEESNAQGPANTRWASAQTAWRLRGPVQGSGPGEVTQPWDVGSKCRSRPARSQWRSRARRAQP